MPSPTQRAALLGHASKLPVTILAIAGNSQAEGVYNTLATVPAQDEYLNKNILVYANLAPTGSSPVFGLVPYQATINSAGGSAIMNAAGGQNYSYEAAVARLLAAKFPNQVFALVKDALYGTTLGAITAGDGNPGADWSENPSTGTLIGLMTTALFGNGSASNPGIRAALLAAGYSIGETIALLSGWENDAKSTNAAMAAALYANEVAFIARIRRDWGVGRILHYRTKISPAHWPLANLVRPQQGKAAVDLGTLLVDADNVLEDSTGHFDAPNGGLDTLAQNFVNRLLGQDNPIGPVLSSVAYTGTVAAQGPDGQALGSINVANTPYPTANHFLTNNVGGAYQVDSESGAFSTVTGAGITYTAGGNNVDVAQGYTTNGVTTLFWTYTVTRTPAVPVSDVASRLSAVDPNDSAHYTLNGSNYSALADIKGGSQSIVQATAARQPTQATVSGSSKKWLGFDGSRVMIIAPLAVVIGATDEFIEFDLVFRPETGPTGVKHIAIVYYSAASIAFGIGYDYTNLKFVIFQPNSSGSATAYETAATYATGANYRLRSAFKAGVIQLLVNGADVTPTVAVTTRATLLPSGQTAGGIALGGTGNVSPELVGEMGEVWISGGKGATAAPTAGERSYIDGLLTNWLAS